MKNTEFSTPSGKGPLSTLRGKITAAILGLLALNALAAGWLLLDAWPALTAKAICPCTTAPCPSP
jgi:methyl-accepting chemotaxis protein